MIDLLKGDCLELMKAIPSGSIDAIITDPPYGTTACKWDSVIDFTLMWEQLNRIIKPNGAIVLFGSEPFSSALRMSNIKDYKYDWVYQKKVPSNFAVAKYQPMKYHENVLVFSKKKHNYYPIKEEREGGGKQRQKYKYTNGKVGDFIGMKNKTVLHTEELRYPSSVQKFNNKAKGDVGKHSTQKPIALMEYLIKTYTNENETVLDFTMGSGSTGVACVNTKRNFIGIEQDENYFDIAKKRIKEAEYKLF
tara:strand:+ start:1113 stop:1859 length:747 start_codon:yes stop_codon:yes gene_type:complete